MLTKTVDSEVLLATLRLNQRSREEVAALAAGRRRFSYAEWQRQARPATPAERADWEDFLRQRDAEREINVTLEAGMEPNREPAG